ncbi:MAG: hypothetical protein ABIH46_02655 [Chloroflexota bacterium]
MEAEVVLHCRRERKMLIQIDKHRTYSHLTHGEKALCGAEVDLALPIPSGPSIKVDLCVECLSVMQDIVRLVKDNGLVISGCLRQEAANLEGFSGRESGDRLAKLKRRVSILRELVGVFERYQ